MKQIPLSGNRGKGLYVLVDDEDFFKLKNFAWWILHSHNSEYARAKIDGKIIPMHRLILNASKGMQVDHRDNNGLNNCKSNLRLCTTQQNQGNRKKGKNNTSGYKGVYRDKNHKKWQAKVTFNYKRIIIGFFDTREEAARAYDKKLRELFGEFACTNLP